MLRCFNVVEYVNQYAESPIFAPLAHVLRLYVTLLFNVVIGVLSRAKYNCLADEIKCMAATPKAPAGWLKAIRLGERSDCGVLVGSIVKYTVA
jgi:hypothetical protein